MFPEDLKISNIALHMAFARDRRLLKELWVNKGTAITVVALDLERSTRVPGELDYITEIGLSTQPMRVSDKRVTRHILVDSTQDKKGRHGFTPPGFGVRSEHVGQEEDLYMLLQEAIKDHKPPGHEVVLTGFAVHNDIKVLRGTINWLPPPDMLVIDVQLIWAPFLPTALAQRRAPEPEECACGLRDPSRPPGQPS